MYLGEYNILIFLIQLFVLLGFSRLASESLSRWKQPPLTAEVLAGIILGPTILGRFAPVVYQTIFPQDQVQQYMLETVIWLGMLFLLLDTGLEVDFSSAWRQRGDALKIALADIIIPISISVIPWLLVPDRYLVNPGHRLAFALFMATIMTITAMPIVARILHDLRVLKTDLGFLILSALSVNDILGWLIFSLVFGMFTQVRPDVLRLVFIAAAAIGFAVFCLTWGRVFAGKAIAQIRERQMPEPGTSLSFICLLGLLCGAMTQKLGMNALFGFLLAGIMAGGARALSEKTRQTFSHMVHAIFVPLFFVGIGVKLDFARHFDIFLVALVTCGGIAARFFGAWVGVNLTQLPKGDRLAVAIAHTPGGAMEIVIGMLALQHGLIKEPVFVAIVVGGLVSAVIAGPWLSYSLKIRKEFSVLEFFARRSVIVNFKTSERNNALHQLCVMAAEQPGMPDAEDIYEAVLRRENEMGTGIEESIAIPHARLSVLSRPVVIFGRSLSGIEWNSPDGKPAHLVFLILTGQKQVSDNVQVQILAAIAKALSKDQTRIALMQAQDAVQVWEVLSSAFAPQRIIRK